MEIVKTSAGTLIYSGEKFIMYAPAMPIEVCKRDFAYRLENDILLNRVVGYAETKHNSKECASGQ